MSLVYRSRFFLAAGLSNVSQAIVFHYLSTPTTSSAYMLGSLSKTKAPKTSPATWHVVTLAGIAYGYHGMQIGNGDKGLPVPVVAAFGLLKFAVASKMKKIYSLGRPGPATAFIGVTEIMWGSCFAYWSLKAGGLIKD